METKKFCVCISHNGGLTKSTYIFFKFGIIYEINPTPLADRYALLNIPPQIHSTSPHSSSKLCILVYFRVCLCQINDQLL